MRRLVLALALALAAHLAAAPAASARTYRIDVPRTLAPQIERVKQRTRVAILLPSRLPAERKRLFGDGSGRRSGYTLELGFTRDCNGANVCDVATFTARRGARPAPGARRVALADGIQGHFTPMQCGASCGSPSIEWVSGGVLYGISAIAGSERGERARMVRLANSAIRKGPR